MSYLPLPSPKQVSGGTPETARSDCQHEGEGRQQRIRYLKAEVPERRPVLGAFFLAMGCLAAGRGGIIRADLGRGRLGRWMMRGVGVVLIWFGTIGFYVGLDLWSVLGL